LSVSAGARMVGGNNVLRLYARIDVLTNGDNLERTRRSAVYVDERIHVTCSASHTSTGPLGSTYLVSHCNMLRRQLEQQWGKVDFQQVLELLFRVGESNAHLDLADESKLFGVGRLRCSHDALCVLCRW
jgi:hypothetical protein